MSRRDKRVAELRDSLREVDPREAHELQQTGAILVDVREPDEVAQGSPRGAVRIVRGFLELRIEDTVPEADSEVLVLCAGGVRSLFAAEDLQRLGYTNVASVRGGFNAWKHEQLPVETPRTLNNSQRERYGRHLLVPEVGEAGQAKLLDSRVLLVGAGGLGSPAALYLAAAGVGTIGIIDDDVVDRSNLQRQVIHTDDRVGTPKVDSAREAIHGINPDIKVVTIRERLTPDNVDDILPGWDVVMDGTDNFPTRYLVNDACVKHRIPNVHGSIFRFEGQVSVFWPSRPEGAGPCYRCLYREPPPPELAPSCAEAGVLGVLPGVVGLLSSVETVKVLLGIGEPLVGKLLHYDALETRFTTLKLSRDADCPYCAEGRPFPGYSDYAQICSTGGAG